MKKNIIIIALAIILLNFIYVSVELLVPLPRITRTTETYIPQGATFREAVEILTHEGLIRDKNLFLFIGRLTGLHRRIRAGYYSITGSMSPLNLLILLKRGQVIEYEITIFEGDTLLEIGDKLAEKNIVDKETFMKLSMNKSFLRSYDIDAPSLEGYLFPDTYNPPKGIRPEDALGMMINNLREKYLYGYKQRAEDIGFTENEVITLASIIEKEAVINSERPMISAVYHNRLKRGMPLQADPTAIYGVKSSKQRITTKDLKRRTPYNTYIFKGLPPGPIASPGLKSIIAALYPANVSYKYFVSNNDGSHQFSVTAGDHIRAVKAYREKKKIALKKQRQMKKENQEKSKKNAVKSSKNESS